MTLEVLVLFLLGILFLYIVFLVYFIISVKTDNINVEPHIWYSLIAIFIFLLVINILHVVISKARVKAKIKREEKEKQKRKEELFREVDNRFSESVLANGFVQFFVNQNWRDIELYRNCAIYTNKITIGKGAFIYRDYGYDNLSLADCRLLAYYIGKAYKNASGKGFSVEEIVNYTTVDRGYTGKFDSLGYLDMRPDYSVSETKLGYYLYATFSAEKREPNFKKW